jgi:uncharacterized protein RhaS with RHS repeats
VTVSGVDITTLSSTSTYDTNDEFATDLSTTRYFHTDNLGSMAVITNETGAAVKRDGYDAWGGRRFPTAPTIPPAASSARPPAASPARRNSPMSASRT